MYDLETILKHESILDLQRNQVHTKGAPCRSKGSKIIQTFGQFAGWAPYEMQRTTDQIDQYMCIPFEP